MKRHSLFSVALYAVAIISATVFARTLVSATLGAPVGEASTTTAGGLSTTSHALVPAVPVPAIYPVRLAIPAINVNAAVQYTGINGKGAIGVPTNFTDVAWYKYGTVPGMKGDAIIDGHVDNGLGLAGVFKNLANVRVGDYIYVTTEQGKKLRFVVNAVTSYGYTNVPVGALLKPGNTAELALITCDGTWLPSQKTYDSRLVVSATLD